jgi:hypothetical protein
VPNHMSMRVVNVIKIDKSSTKELLIDVQVHEKLIRGALKLGMHELHEILVRTRFRNLQ